MTRKIIYVTPKDEIDNKFPHGQFQMLVPGVVVNFACDADEHNVAKVGEMADKLAAFLASDRAVFAFDSPHLPGKCYLTRYGATQVAAVLPAWSDKVMPKVVDDGIDLYDSRNDLPILKRNN